MNVSTLADGLLALAQQERLTLGEDLEQDERTLRELTHRVGAKALEKHVNQSKPGYEGSSRVCPHCGQSQRFVNHRPKTVVTLLGDIRVKRAYYRCDHCKQASLPWDQRMGLGRRACSVGVAKAATWCGAHEPFEQASVALKELAAVRLDDSTIHRLTMQVGDQASQMEEPAACEALGVEATPDRLYTAVDGLFVHLDGDWREVKAATCYWENQRGEREARYRVRHEPVEQFVPYVESLLMRCGHHQARENILLGDGIPWIWKRIGAVMKPQTVHITDWYHVDEHVGECGKALHGEGTKEAGAWIEPIKTMLWEGELRRLRKHLDEQLNRMQTPANRSAVQALITYIRNQGDRLVYDDFRAAGYDIGSGRVEACCKHVVAQRAKRSGMQWSSPGFQNTLSLRCAYLNGHDDDLWARRPLAA
jgi:hypothetical protein